MTVQEKEKSGAATGESLHLALLGSETRFYDAAGIRTRAIEAGTGYPLILLHGVGGTAEAYARNVVPLGEHFHVYALDALGHGLTGTIPGPHSYKEYTKHLIDFMDAAGIEKAHVGGESLGGWISVWAAILYPERVANVLYIVGAKLGPPNVPEEAMKKTRAGQGELVRLSKQLRENPSWENTRERMKWLFHNVDRDLADELVSLRWKLYERGLSEDSPEGARTAGPSSSAEQQDDKLTPEVLARLKARTLVLWTDHNPSQVLAVAEASMPYWPNAELVVMNDCGHWPQWEDTPTFNRIVVDFLKRGAQA